MDVHCYVNGVLHVICVSNPIVDRSKWRENTTGTDWLRSDGWNWSNDISSKSHSLRFSPVKRHSRTPFAFGAWTPKCSVVTNNDGKDDLTRVCAWWPFATHTHTHIHMCDHPNKHQHFTHTHTHISRIGGDKVWAAIKRNCPNPRISFFSCCCWMRIRRLRKFHPPANFLWWPIVHMPSSKMVWTENFLFGSTQISMTES